MPTTYQPDSRAAPAGQPDQDLGFILPDLENASYAKLAKRLDRARYRLPAADRLLGR